MAAPIVCTPDATLGEVIQRVVAEKVHRMYVVDENSHPLGVITLTDILHLLHPS
jgi:CBS domain-containing protein